MSKQQTIVYRARSLEDAYRLKNLLAEEHVDAVVLNDGIASGLQTDGGGGAQLGSAAVAVSEEHVVRALKIAAILDRKHAADAQQQQPADAAAGESADVIDHWPRCPECDARRTTRCTICGTAGSEFPQSDMGFIWVPQPGDMVGAAGCQCGPGGCSGAGDHAAHLTPHENAGQDPDEPDAPDETEASMPTVLICTTCDEPFVPEYPRVCEWCGHEFADGYEVERGDALGEPEHQLNARVVGVMVGLLLVAAGLLGYFMFIL